MCLSMSVCEPLPVCAVHAAGPGQSCERGCGRWRGRRCVARINLQMCVFVTKEMKFFHAAGPGLKLRAGMWKVEVVEVRWSYLLAVYSK